MSQTKLIILRGPSGAGKSTIARLLHDGSKRRVALIEQDHYREKLLNNGDGIKPESKALRLEMFETDIRIALKHGFDVIVEGILNPNSYVPIFQSIWKDHPHENYMFYFDVSFDETVRRHQGREKAASFGADDMREWYKFAKRSDLDWEVIIPEESSREETLSNIRSATGI